MQLLLIDGAWQQSATLGTYETFNPFTGEVASRAAAATTSDVVRAVGAAERAFPAWAALPPNERRRILWAAAVAVEARAEAISEAITVEMGGTADWGHFNTSALAEKLRYAAGAVHEVLTGEVLPSEKSTRTSMAIRKPVGVVACLIPWNVPALLVGNSVPSALAAGNAVVMKASEQTPHTHGLIAECLTEAGVPDGVFNLITNAPEDAPEVVHALIAHPAVRLVHFTGSTRVGRIIAQKAAVALKRTILELGGKAPVLVLADADLDQAVEAAAFGSFANSGQGCIVTERLIVDRTIADEFIERLAARATTFSCGDPRDRNTMFGPIVGQDSLKRLSCVVEEAVEAGAKLVTGGTADGPCFAPTVLVDVTSDMRAWREESFGPIVTVVAVDGPEEALRMANDTDYGLSAAIFTSNVPLAIDLAKRLDVGMCHINGMTLEDEAQAPFGGVKDSGYGRSGGRAGMQEFTDIQWITIDGP